MVAISGSGRSEHELKLVPVRSLLAAEPRVKRAPCARSSPGSVRLALTFSLFGRNPGRANARCGLEAAAALVVRATLRQALAEAKEKGSEAAAVMETRIVVAP